MPRAGFGERSGGALEHRLDDVVRVAAGQQANVQGQARRRRQRAKEVCRKLPLELTDAHPCKLQVVHEVRPARQIEGDHGQRLVHGQQAGTVAANAALVAKRLLERLSESETDVFDGVMAVHVKVALCLDDEIEAGVVSEQCEHVIEEPDARAHLCRSGAVDNQRDEDVGLGGAALHLCAARTHAGPPSAARSRAERAWARKPSSSAMAATCGARVEAATLSSSTTATRFWKSTTLRPWAKRAEPPVGST